MGGKKKPGVERGRGRETQPQQAVPQQQPVQQVPSASGSPPQLTQPPTAVGISEQPQPATAQEQQQMASARQKRTTGVSGETEGDQTRSTKAAPKEPPQHKQQAEESRQGHQPKQVPQNPPGAQAASPMPPPSGERTVSAGDQVKMMEKEMKELMFKRKVEKTPFPKRPERPASCWGKQITVVSKMGGKNYTIDPRDNPEVLKRPVIVIGVDVSHPAPSEHSKPSIAAAVASIDSKLCRYAASVKVQQSDGRIQSRVEVIKEFKDMVKELLRAFYKNTRCKPEKIIVYRDGVSEGQFTDVRNKEIQQIREACLDMPGDYKPGITFIIVQKPHHTRFKPKDRNEGIGRHGNIPPGTTIDIGVIQETSRTSHYYVVWDDSDFSADELYKLTYHLCHVYTRCTRTISAPAPVRYADLVVYHARHHLKGEQEMSSSSGEVHEEHVDLSQEIKNAILIHEGLKKSMYFV